MFLHFLLLFVFFLYLPSSIFISSFLASSTSSFHPSPSSLSFLHPSCPFLLLFLLSLCPPSFLPFFLPSYFKLSFLSSTTSSSHHHFPPSLSSVHPFLSLFPFSSLFVLLLSLSPSFHLTSNHLSSLQNFIITPTTFLHLFPPSLPPFPSPPPSPFPSSP